MRKATLLAACVLMILGLASMASSQTIYNPRILQFDSPDHVTQVLAYKVEIWLSGVDPQTGAPIMTLDLAKVRVVPSGAPAGEPQLQANFTDLTPLPSYPSGQTYVLRMVAVGLDGIIMSPRSTPSGPFAAAGVPASVVLLRVR